jgi:hypothetical protein
MKPMKKISLTIVVVFVISVLVFAIIPCFADEQYEDGDTMNLLYSANNNELSILYGKDIVIELTCMTNSQNCYDIINQLDNRLKQLGFTTDPTNFTKTIKIYAGFKSDSLNEPTGETEETVLFKSDNDFKIFAYGKKTVEDIIDKLGIISPDPPAEEPTENYFRDDIRT